MLKTIKKPNSRKLNETIETAGAPVFLMYDYFWAHERSNELLTPFLILLHQIVRASVPLMEAASREAAKRAETDPVCRQLHEYMEIHIQEEANHDTWLMEDLETAGLSQQQVLAMTPSTSVAAMVGSQYYWLHHHHPVALLGYIRLLEGNPPSTEHIERLKERSGLPESMFRTYRLHGELDPHHLQEFDDMLDALPLTAAHAVLIQTSAVYTAHMMANCLSELMTGLDSKQAMEA